MSVKLLRQEVLTVTNGIVLTRGTVNVAVKSRVSNFDVAMPM